MRKTLRYIALGIGLIAFVFAFVKTGSFKTAIIIAAIGLGWFLLENVFEFLNHFSNKPERKLNDNSYKKDRETLEENDNPSIR